MEKSISAFIRESLNIAEVDINSYSPLTLAYIGDAIFDLIIRTAMVSKGNNRADSLHKATASIVKAKTQSDMIEKMLLYLTEEEAAVYRRGRNAKSHTPRSYPQSIPTSRNGDGYGVQTSLKDRQ